MELIHHGPIGSRLLYRIEILPLDVLDERDLHHLLLGGDVHHERGDRRHTGRSDRPQPTLSGEDLVSPAELPHQDGLDHALLQDGSLQFLDVLRIELRTRLVGIRGDVRDIDLPHFLARVSIPGGRLYHIGDQRAKTSPERLSSHFL